MYCLPITIIENEEEEENEMETEDREDAEDAEKPNINFDPSLPTSHAVGFIFTSTKYCCAAVSVFSMGFSTHTVLILLSVSGKCFPSAF